MTANTSPTDAELTILGLVAERPRHGYELEIVIRERGIREWTSLGFSSIYYVLGKLEKRGLVEAVDPSQPARARSVRLTDTGAELVRTASLDAIATPTPVHARVLVGLASGPGLSRAEVLAALERRASALGEELARVRAARDGGPHLPPEASALFAYTEAVLQADARWSSETIAALTKESQHG
jgi:DNA-binding PadR family transcriptional regulator